MGVGDGGKAAFRLQRIQIALGHFLLPAVPDGASLSVYRQAGCGVCPAVFRVQGDCADRCTAGHEGHLYVLRPQAVPVLIVRPDLPDHQICGLRHVGVGKHRGAAADSGGGVVALGFFLLPGVDNVLADRGMYRQTVCGVGPAVCRIQCDFPDLRAASQKLHADFVRPDAVLVVPIRPGLPDRKILRLRHMGVGQHRPAHTGFLAGLIAFRHFFLPGIGDPFAKAVQGHIFCRICPIVFRVQDRG